MVLSYLATPLRRAPVVLLVAGALNLGCVAGASATQGAAFPTHLPGGFGGGPPVFPSRTRDAPVDSLARADILSCLAPERFRLATFSSGSVRGAAARGDLRGVYVAPLHPNDGRERFVAWSDIRRVEMLETHLGSRADGFERGSSIGLAIGVVTILLVTRPPGDFGDLVYPLAVVIGAVPFGLVGGLIGSLYPPVVTKWEHCWP